MRAAGRLQLLIWRARAQLRKWTLARHLVRLFRKLAPDTRERHLRGEVRFWRNCLISEGLLWTTTM
jgi:hypothetical protein